MERNYPDENTAFLVQMLLLSGSLKKYFGVQERGRIKSHRTVPIYRDMERYGTVCKSNKEF